MINDGARIFVPRSIAGRMHLARGRYLGKVAYAFKYQVPTRSQVEVQLARLDKALSDQVLGAKWIAHRQATQRREDGGLGLITAASTMKALWSDTVRRVLDPTPRPWKHFARYYVRRTYGENIGSGTQLFTANITWARLTELPHGMITEKMTK